MIPLRTCREYCADIVMRTRGKRNCANAEEDLELLCWVGRFWKGKDSVPFSVVSVPCLDIHGKPMVRTMQAS